MPLAPTRRTAAEQRTTKEARRPQNNKLADIYIHTHTEREREREQEREINNNNTNTDRHGYRRTV